MQSPFIKQTMDIFFCFFRRVMESSTDLGNYLEQFLVAQNGSIKIKWEIKLDVLLLFLF